MASIVFVNPPYSFRSVERTYLRAFIGTMPSLGLLSLAAVGRKRGDSVKIIESSGLLLSLSQTVDQILRAEPDIIGFSCPTASVGNAARIAAAAKGMRPRSLVLIGGPHVTALPVETLRRYPVFDYGVMGEGERVLVRLLDALEGRLDLRRVNGIVYRDGAEVRANPSAEFIENLDELPFPAYDLLPSFPEAYRPAFLNYLRGPTASLTSSRGCPQTCTFCDRSVFGNRYRYFSEDYLLELISSLVRRNGIRQLIFCDDQFAASRPRLERLFEGVARQNLVLRWNCDARADSVDPKLLKLMKRAGCWMISYGIESGSQEILDGVEKRIELERVEQALRWTREAGIRAKGLFMIGYREETDRSLKQTLSFIQRSPLDEINLSFVTPYPGTELYRQVRGSPDFSENWEKMNALHCVLRPTGVSCRDLERAYAALIRKFYFRPGVTVSYAGLLVRSPENMARLGAGLGGILLRGGKMVSGLGRRDLIRLPE